MGADGCRGGWVAALAIPGTVPRLRRCASLADVLGWARAQGALVVGVDIPIGLPGPVWRECDLEARRRLGAARSRVFLTPARSTVQAWAATAGRPYVERFAVTRAAAPPGRGLSAQAAGLLDKVVAADVLARAGAELVEVHPELSFSAMAGGPALPGKRTWPGIARRLALLASAYPGLDPASIADDDEADALAVAWSAARVAAGTAEQVPDPAPRDAAGLLMRICW